MQNCTKGFPGAVRYCLKCAHADLPPYLMSISPQNRLVASLAGILSKHEARVGKTVILHVILHGPLRIPSPPSLPCSALLCAPRRLPYAWPHQGLPTPAFQVGQASPRTGRRRDDRRGVRSGHSFSSFLPCQILNLGRGLGFPPQGHSTYTGTLTELLVSPWENSFLSLLIRCKGGNASCSF